MEAFTVLRFLPACSSRPTRWLRQHHRGTEHPELCSLPPEALGVPTSQGLLVPFLNITPSRLEKETRMKNTIWEKGPLQCTAQTQLDIPLDGLRVLENCLPVSDRHVDPGAPLPHRRGPRSVPSRQGSSPGPAGTPIAGSAEAHRPCPQLRSREPTCQELRASPSPVFTKKGRVWLTLSCPHQLPSPATQKGVRTPTRPTFLKKYSPSQEPCGATGT